MVKNFNLFWILCVSLLFASNAYADVKVTAEAEGPNIYENTPIKVLVTVMHPTKEIVNDATFKSRGKSVAAKLIDEKVMTATGDLQLSMYHIEMPALPKGLHLVPEIEVKVGSKTYRSIPTTFQVMAGGSSSPAAAPQQSQSPYTPAATPQGNYSPPKNVSPSLKFEGFVDGPKTLYPNQKTLVGYTYTYNTNMETTSEETPLLEAKGLLKVGDKIVEEDEKNGVSTLKITQIVKGGEPGEFTYGPSTMETVPYQLNAGNQRAYASEKLSSTTPAIKIKVIPYPAVEKPASFNGAIGDFNWKVALTSSPNVSVGDELSLSIDAIGKGDWDTVNLPELCCQPSISGQFRLSDLPAVGKLNGDTKHFEVQLRPLSMSITEIPSFEFSSLNPDTGKYRVITTEPIPLKIESAVPKPDVIPQKEGAESLKLKNREEFNRVQPLEIPGNKTLTTSDLYDLRFGNWWVLFLIPFGIGLLIFQFNWKNFLTKQQGESDSNETKSETILQQAQAAPLGSSLQYDLLNKALVTRLFEVGEVLSDRANPQLLKPVGLQGEVRDFMLELEAMRYAGKQEKSDEELLKRAQNLYKKIGEASNE